MSSNQESYLQRQPDKQNSSIFDWFTCCVSSHTVIKQELKPNTNSIIIKKKPLKNLANKLDNSSHKIKENNNQTDSSHNTQRKIFEMKPSSTNTQSSNLGLSNIYNSIQSLRKEKTIKTRKVRFSYIYPINTNENIHTKQNNSSFKIIRQRAQDGSFNNYQAHNTFKGLLAVNKAVLLQKINQLTNKQSVQQKEKVDKSPQLKQNKDKSRKDLFTLNMRQVQSIKEPQDDSDHESFVQDKSDHALFALLSSIRQIEKQSNISRI